jgi:glycosyltransferase involved in cell wall biosynthesis
MHRSGTSALTRVISLLGAALPKNLYPAGVGNESGFWEPENASKIHDQMLQAAGTAVNEIWDPKGDWSKTQTARSFIPKIKQLIAEEYGDTPLFVVKDPRLSLVLPLWLEALRDLDIAPRVIVCFRNPIEVARSLRVRQAKHFPFEVWHDDRGGLLWLRYLLSAERYSRGALRAFLDYSDLLSDWRGTMGRLSSALKLEWPRGSASVEHEIDTFLTSSLRHQESSISLTSLGHPWKQWIEPLSRELRRANAGAEPNHRALDQIFENYRHFVSLLGPYLATLNAQIDRLGRALGASQSERDSAIQRAQETEHESATIQAERDGAESALAASRQGTQDILAGRDASVATLQVALGSAAAERDALAEEQFVQWALKARILLGLLRRRFRFRVENVNAQIAAMRVGEVIADSFVSWYCTTQVLSGLLRRSNRQGEAALVSKIQALKANRISPGPCDPGDFTASADVSGEKFQRGASPNSPKLIDEIDAGKILEHVDNSRPARISTLSPTQLETYYRHLGFASTVAKKWADLAEGVQVEQSDFATLAEGLRDNVVLAGFASRIRESELFDESFYREQAGLKGSPLDYVLHYLLIGEPSGLSPSAEFDPAYYAWRYFDVTNAGLSCLWHYEVNGRRESRQGRSPVRPRVGRQPENPLRDNVIIVVHETTRTGAPILGWNIAERLAQHYNVFTIFLSGGVLTEEFEGISAKVLGPFGDRSEIDFSVRSLFDKRFKYAIVNSIASHSVLETFANHSIPTVLLVHEFLSMCAPPGTFQSSLDLAGEIIFPASTVLQSAIATYPSLANRRLHVESQGASYVPKANTWSKPPTMDQLNFLAATRAEGGFIAIGAGSVSFRKGVDLFIAMAAEVRSRVQNRSTYFVWVGSGYDPDHDMGYSIYLKEQLERSGLDEQVIFLDELADLEPIYELAHVLVLTSRLDPLPNVTIDAAHRGLPIICFRNASGTAELMLQNEEAAQGVVPYLDVSAAAQLVSELASNESKRLHMAKAIKSVATMTDMRRYVARLDEIGSELSAAQG